MEKTFEKSLTMPKKTNEGTLWDFSTAILSQNFKKFKEGPFGGKILFRKNCHNAEKN